MNAARRQTLTKIIAAIEEAKSLLNSIATDIENVRDEEQDTYDNMPESFQNGDKGEKAQTAIDAMTSAYDEVTGIEDTLEEASSSLQEAIDA